MIVYPVALAVISLVALILYGADKSKAKRGAWRIPEKVLLGFSLLGGAVGGLLGHLPFRHKPKHWNFWLLNFIGLAWQICLLVYLLFFTDFPLFF